MPDYPYSYLIMHTRDTILHTQQKIIMIKAHVKFQPDWSKISQEKVKEAKKRINYAQLRMQLIPSVQVSGRSDYCITTNIM